MRASPVPDFTLIAHRGAKDYAPENTLAAMRKALELGAAWIEFDVHFIGGQVLVAHGPTVTDIRGKRFRLYGEDPSVLRALDLGGGERIPTLGEVLACVERRARLNIELKGPQTAEPVTRILQSEIRAQRWRTEDFLVSSFNYEELARLKHAMPEVPVGVLVNEVSRGFLAFARQVQATHLNVSVRLATPKLVQEARQLGLEVFVFTVNSVRQAKRLQQMGVAGVFTDSLERLKPVVND